MNDSSDPPGRDAPAADKLRVAEDGDAVAADALVHQLDEELQRAREQLRATAEDFETLREEMRARHEELQAANHELKVRVDEVGQAHADLQNLLSATEIGTLFLDRDLRIQRYTPHSAGPFNIRPADVGRPLAELRSALVYEDLLADARRAIETPTVVEREVRGDGQWYLVRHWPYRVTGDRVTGILLTFVDVTAQKQAEQEAAAARDFAQHVLDTVGEGVLVLSDDLHVLSANHSFYETFGGTEEQTVGRLVYDLGDGQWDLPELRALLEEVLPTNRVFSDYAVSHELEGVGWRTVLLSGRQLGRQQKILLRIEDVSERGALGDRMDEAVRERTEQSRRLASALVMAEQRERRRISSVLHDHLQQLLYGLQLHVSRLASAVPDGLRDQVERVSTLLDDAGEVTRTLTVELSPPVLKGEGLDAALDWLALQVEATNGLRVEVQTAGPVRVPDEVMRVLLFQIVRELLFHVAEHAQTDTARVEIEDAAAELRIAVVAEGVGFDFEAADRLPEHGHVGLVQVRERLELFGGRLETESVRGEGTRATIVVPHDRPGA